MRVLGLAGMVFVLAVAAPAQAQFAGSIRGPSGTAPVGIRGDIIRPAEADPAMAAHFGVGRDVRSIRGDIRNARESGQLSRREARSLIREGRRIEAASDRYAAGGYSDAELAALRGRTEALRSALVATRSRAAARR